MYYHGDKCPSEVKNLPQIYKCWYGTVSHGTDHQGKSKGCFLGYDSFMSNKENLYIVKNIRNIAIIIKKIFLFLAMQVLTVNNLL